MKIFALSDIHIDYEENRKWLFNLPQSDYKDDILILAGDITDNLTSIAKAFQCLKNRFQEVLYVPGNHDLWVHRNKLKNSLESFTIITTIAEDYGITTKPVHLESLSIIPLLGWFDYTFGEPTDELIQMWYDYTACKWPDDFDEKQVTQHFVSMNEEFLDSKNDVLITFSHFLPRIDLMPRFIPLPQRKIYPVLGTTLLEQQIRTLGSQIHIYGHSHLNRRVMKDNTMYINNAFGYPSESRITAKELLCIYEL